MIVGVDGGALSVDDERLKVGVYQFSLNLLRHSSLLDKHNTYQIFSFKPIDKTIMYSLGKNFVNVVLNPSVGWSKIRLPIHFVFNKIDVFLALNQSIPPYHPFKIIGFVHALDFNKEFHAKTYKRLEKNTQDMIEASDLIVTSSQFLKRSIITEYRKNNIKVINPGVSEYFKKMKNYKENKDDYFLFVGSLKPSKNIKSILRAFARFQKRNKNKFKLFIIASDFWSDEGMAEIVKEEKIKSYVEFLGFVENENLPKFYRGAIALLSPSLYEGFGIPLVEAMKCGCPVIAGNQTAEKEIVRSGGILVDPSNVDEITEAMRRVLIENKDYRDNAIKDSKKFSWDKFAKEFIKILIAYEKTD